MKRIAILLAAIAGLGLACGRGEIKGTYEIELQIAGATQPLFGTLILSTLPLDIPSHAGDDDSIDSEWFGGDALSANSCFILSPKPSLDSGAGDEPLVVRIFEARIQPDGILMPIEILHASDLQIQIVELKFFASALGGEIEVRTDSGTRPGRIVGARVDAARPRQCVDQLEEFRGYLESLPTGDVDA